MLVLTTGPNSLIPDAAEEASYSVLCIPQAPTLRGCETSMLLTWFCPTLPSHPVSVHEINSHLLFDVCGHGGDAGSPGITGVLWLLVATGHGFWSDVAGGQQAPSGAGVGVAGSGDQVWSTAPWFLQDENANQ